MSKPMQMDQRERESNDIFFVDFKGMNVQAKRQAIQENQFRWLEEAMPIGRGNLRICPAASSVLASIPNTEVISFTTSCNIAGNDHIFAFTQSGAGYDVNVQAGYSVTKFAAAGTFSATGVSGAQWKNERLLIGDPNNGYFTYDTNALISNGGVAFVTITNGGSGYTSAPTITFSSGSATGIPTISGGIVTGVIITNGGSYTVAPTVTFSGGGGSGAAGTANLLAGPAKITALAVYSGHVWAANNRSVNFSDTALFYAFSGGTASSFTITDATLHNNITGLETANNFLYIFGDDSIDVLGDVGVSGGALVFTRSNITASIGSSFSPSLFPYYRAMMFAGGVGFYSLSGATPEKISGDLDDLFTLIDQTKPITGGQVSIFNILCAAFAFTFTDTISPNQVGAVRQILAIFFDKKWWLSKQITGINYILSFPVSNQIRMYGWAGTNLSQLFFSTSLNVSTVIQTKLFDDEKPLLNKQAQKLGVQATYSATANSTLTATLDSEFSSFTTISSMANLLQFVNNAGQPIQFVSNGNVPINFTGGGYTFSIGDGQISDGKYIGSTITSTSPAFSINAIAFQYKDGARW